MSAATGAARRPGAEKPVLIALLSVLAAVCWAYLLFRAIRVAPAETPALAGMGMLGPAPPAPYRLDQLALVLALWVVVCSAMMLPGAAPAVLLFASVSRLYHAVRRPYLATALFVLGYLVLWTGFAALATLLQWALHDAGVLDAAMAVPNATFAGLALVAAGVYQWTPAKHDCLQRCRAPLPDILTGWRPGPWGAFRMGIAYGLVCIGCCWLLLLLLFAAGIASLAAIVGLATLVLAEKLLPGGPWLACLTGLALVAWGTLMLFP